jgi:arsenate reductase
MDAAGIDISSQESTQLTDELLAWVDTVVTVCGHADEHCPMLPAGTIKLHWPLADPAKATGIDDEVSAIFCATRDDIRSRVLALVS